MTLKCLAYRALDLFRRSPAARVPYKGHVVRLYEPITVTGAVTIRASAEADGDCCFDLYDPHDGQSWHCEVTPCQPHALRTLARNLALGQVVTVSGTKRWDPQHVFGGRTGKWEIHPVMAIEE